MSLWQIFHSVKTVLSQDPSQLDPSGQVILLLSPYISQNSVTGDDVKINITNFVNGVIKSTNEQQIPDVIDELEHLVSHYATQNHKGHVITDCILEGLTEALRTQTGAIKFNNIYKVQQAYWDRLQYHDPDRHRMHRTIRINGMPFAEGALVYLMRCYADKYGINLEIIDIAWRDVGAALLTNRVDVAFYPNNIIKQLGGLHRLARNRLVFRTAPVFTYNNYYFLSRANFIPRKPDLSAITKGVAVVPNSDHEEVLKDWYKHESPRRFLWKVKSKPSLEKIIVPVASPDDALRDVVDGDVDYCVAGGIHTQYATEALKGIIQSSEIPVRSSEIPGVSAGTDVFFWAVSSRMDDSKWILKDVISLWAHVNNEWQTIKKGARDNKLRAHCVTYVNRQPNQAFVTDEKGRTPEYPEDIFERLASLIDKHDQFLDPPAGEILPIDIEGW
jgi:hypothetical protein